MTPQHVEPSSTEAWTGMEVNLSVDGVEWRINMAPDEYERLVADMRAGGTSPICYDAFRLGSRVVPLTLWLRPSAISGLSCFRRDSSAASGVASFREHAKELSRLKHVSGASHD